MRDEEMLTNNKTCPLCHWPKVSIFKPADGERTAQCRKCLHTSTDLESFCVRHPEPIDVRLTPAPKQQKLF